MLLTLNRHITSHRRNSAEFTGKGKHLCRRLVLAHLRRRFFFNKVEDTPTQVCSYEFCENFKNNYFEDYLPTAEPG